MRQRFRSEESGMDRRLRRLLSEFGYELRGHTIIQKGIRGFASDQVFGQARSMFDACERLIPIIHDDNFSSEFRRITEPK